MAQHTYNAYELRALAEFLDLLDTAASKTNAVVLAGTQVSLEGDVTPFTLDLDSDNDHVLVLDLE